MEQLIAEWLKDAPIVAILAFGIWKLYTDGRADRQYMMNLLEKLYMYVIRMSGGDPSDHEETLMQRPQ